MATRSGRPRLGLDPGTRISANSPPAPREEDADFLLGARPLLSWEQMSLLPAGARALGWLLSLLQGSRNPGWKSLGFPRGGSSAPPLWPGSRPWHPLTTRKGFWALPEPCFLSEGPELGCADGTHTAALVWVTPALRRNGVGPPPAWLNRLGITSQTERLPVQFSIRAQSWIAGSVPSQGTYRK